MVYHHPKSKIKKKVKATVTQRSMNMKILFHKTWFFQGFLLKYQYSERICSNIYFYGFPIINVCISYYSQFWIITGKLTHRYFMNIYIQNQKTNHLARTDNQTQPKNQSQLPLMRIYNHQKTSEIVTAKPIVHFIPPHLETSYRPSLIPQPNFPLNLQTLSFPHDNVLPEPRWIFFHNWTKSKWWGREDSVRYGGWR